MTSKSILVVTCPSGKQCSHLLPLLYRNSNFTLRLAAFSQGSYDELTTAYPNAEIKKTDLTVLNECQKLLKGATSVFHVGPSLHSREKEIGLNLVDAAVAESQREGNIFKHFVFSSVICTQLRQLMQHDLKSYIEERLMASPLNWTILKPTNFMDAYPVKMLAEAERPCFEKLWTPEIPNSVIALRDLAEAAAKVLVEGSTHYFGEYPLSGTMPVSDAEIVRAIGKAIGKNIEIKAPSIEQGASKLLTYLFGKHAADEYAKEDGGNDIKSRAAWDLSAPGDLRGDIVRDGAERLVLFYMRRGLKGSPNVLRWLLGREPTSVDEWIQIQLRGDDPLLRLRQERVQL